MYRNKGCLRRSWKLKLLEALGVLIRNILYICPGCLLFPRHSLLETGFLPNPAQPFLCLFVPIFLTRSITGCLQRILSGLQHITPFFESSFPWNAPSHAPDTAVKLGGAIALQIHLATSKNLSSLLPPSIPAVQ